MKRLIAILIALSIAMIPAFSYADTLKTTISGKDNVTEGQTFTVTVSFKSKSLDSLNANIIYDDRYLSYVSGGTSAGDGGIVYINAASDDGKSVSSSIKFKARASGDANVVARDVEASDLMGNTIKTEGASIYVHVAKAKAEPAEEPEEEAAEEETAAEEEPAPEPVEEPEEDAGNGIWILIAVVIITAAVLIALIAVWLNKRKKEREE